MAPFFLWYLFLFQRYSSFPIMQIYSLMTSSVVQVPWCDTKLRISPPIIKQCYYLAGMLHPTRYTRWYTHFDVAMATCSVLVSCPYKRKYYHMRLNMAKYLVLSKTYANPTFSIRTSQPANNVYLFHEILTRNQRQQNLWQGFTIPKRIMRIKVFSEEAILWYKSQWYTER